MWVHMAPDRHSTKQWIRHDLANFERPDGGDHLTVDTLTLWDSSAEPSEHVGRVYRWNGYKERASVYSLLLYVEIHGERLRRKYLSWIHELGESCLDGKRLIDHLAFEDGLSYWWLTLFVEKSPWKQPAIIDAIRLMALEEVILQQIPDKLRLVSSNKLLHETIRDLCQRLEIDYEWANRPLKKRHSMRMRDLYRTFPHPIQALISLARHVWGRWLLSRSEKPDWFGRSDNSLFFCSYFDNIDPKAADQGRFHSYYWVELHTLLNRFGCRSNWLQLFIPCALIPTSYAAMSQVQTFNRNGRNQDLHAFLDAYLSRHVILRVLKRWLQLNLIAWHLSTIKHVFRPLDSQLSLWPLMRGDWRTSIYGTVAISNLLWIELFDLALRDLPHQTKGFYLCENQGWERALIHAWRKHGHGQLIAVAHSTMRFWDLRYFNDPRTIRSTNMHPMPQPNLIALNGKAAVDGLLSMDYPKEAIVECEALRYGYINDIQAGHSSIKGETGAINVLILGDYKLSATTKMLSLLEAALLHITTITTYTIKPHPNFTVKAGDFSSLNLKVVILPLGEVMHDFDIAYSSNSTSAAIDAYLAGLPVVVLLDEMELNFSPLRSRTGVRFVSTPEELAEALQMGHRNTVNRLNSSDFFFLNPELPRWTHLLTN